MALRKNIQTEGSVIISSSYGTIDKGIEKVSFDAYIKVVSVSGDKEKGIADVLFIGDNLTSVKKYNVLLSVDFDSPNFIKQAYLYLKTLPEFAGAVDC